MRTKSSVQPLSSEDTDFSARWHNIKALFAAHIAGGGRLSARRRMKGEQGNGQRRFGERVTSDERDYEYHIDYIHYNPVKYGHVTGSEAWPLFRSFHRYVRRGIYNLEWGQMMTFGVYTWTDAKGGMNFAFHPTGFGTQVQA
jgi:putative transposase